MRYFLTKPDSFRPNFERDRFVSVSDALPTSLINRWQQQAQGMKQYARTVIRRELGFELAYRVVTGDDIRTHWPELFDFYNGGCLLEWIKNLTGDDTSHTSPDIQSAINLNILDAKSFKYRWHFDAVCYTAILYLSAVRLQDGGALRLVPNCRPHVPPNLSVAKIIEISPRAGTIVVMDGTRCYHSIAPMLENTVRLSVPLVFPNSEASTRPPGLDSYLYDRAA